MERNDKSNDDGQLAQPLHSLIDIEPPVTPPTSNTPVIFSTLLLSILLATILRGTLNHWKSSRSHSRRQLNKLKNNISINRHGNNDPRENSYQLVAILAQGLGLNGIVSTTPLPSALIDYEDRWNTFTSQLSVIRFSDQKQSSSTIDALIEEAHYWLRVWP